MTVQLCHKALAECHNLTIGFALRIKIRTALAAADRQTGQRVLEYLLKAQELDYIQRNRRMQTQTALIRSDRAVELYTETTVYLHIARVVYPRNTELNLTLRLNQTLQNCLFAVLLLMRFHYRTQRLQNLFDRLMELRFARVLCNNLLNHFINIRHFSFPPRVFPFYF